MKILHIMPYCPYPPQFGGALRVYNLLKQMVAAHEVTVVYPGYRGSDDDLQEALGGKIAKIHVTARRWTRVYRRLGQLYSTLTPHSYFYHMGWDGRTEKILRNELENGRYDLVQTEFTHMASYDLPTDAVKILDEHNVEYDVLQRQWQMATSPFRKFHYRDEYRKIFREEMAACRKQDLVMVTSERDRALLDTDLPEVRKFVLPNGVDASYFRPSPVAPDADTIVFTGMMKYLPNSDGMLYFLESIFPLILAKVPGAKVLIVGAEPPASLRAKESSSVIITDRVEDVRPWVDRAAVSIVPLRMGGGTRLKIVESFAMKKPVVSTAIGAEGIDAVDGESIMIADEPAAFADAVVRLLQDAGLRAKLAASGHELMLRKYEWSVIGLGLERAYAGAFAARKTARDGRPAGERLIEMKGAR
jgi:glycosyltransferase involved in cell wall biosynthesis